MRRLGASDSLEEAVQALASTDDEGLPVTSENDHLIGWITHRRVLRAYLDRYGSPETTGTPLATGPTGGSA